MRSSDLRFRRSSSATCIHNGQIGSPHRGGGLLRSPSETWRGSGPPWRIRSPGSLPFLRTTRFHPKTSTEAVAEVAQPPNRPIRQGGPQSMRLLQGCQRLWLQGRKLQSEVVGSAAAAAVLAEEEEGGAADAVVGRGRWWGSRGAPQRHGLEQQLS